MTPKVPSIVIAIDALEPSAESIRTLYCAYVDPTPVCGWFAMLSELLRIASDKKDHRRTRVSMWTESVLHEAKCRLESGSVA